MTIDDFTPWVEPDTSLEGRYDDRRLLSIEPSFNSEVAP